jgi:hyperosmotically inducible protein
MMKTHQRYLAAAAAGTLLAALIGCSHEPEHGNYSSANPPGTATQVVDDVTITNNVQAALANAPGVNASQVNVQTSDGVVTLSGDVSSSSAASAAVSAAQGVNGVSSVKNDLNVSPTPPQN